MDDLRHPRPAARPAPRCSRRAPAPARPGPSPRWSPATSPRARPARADAGGDVRPGGQPGAARAGPRSSWSRPSAHSATTRPSPGEPDSDLIHAAARLPTPTERRGAAPPGARGARRLRRRDHRDHPPVLPAWCCGSLGVAGDTDARARLVEDLDDLLVEVVDDLYLRAFAYADDDPAFDRAEALAHRPRRRRRPAGPARARPTTDAPDAGRTRGCAFADAVRAEMDRRKRRLGVLSLRRPAQPARRRARATTTPRPAAGCGSAGRSCWSTSSRTPTRCSGRSSTGRSPATPRWC